MINGRIIYDDNEPKVLDIHNIVSYRRVPIEERYDNFSQSKPPVHEAVDFGGHDTIRVTIRRITKEQAYKFQAWWAWARRGEPFSFDFLPGLDLVTNGTFNTDSDWSKDPEWSITGGVADCDGTQSGNTEMHQTISSLTDGKIYTVIYTVINYVAGTIRPYIGTGAGAAAGLARSANGTYKQDLTMDAGSTLLRFQGNVDFEGQIDDVICFLAPGDTTLDGDADSHQKTIPLTITPFSIGDYAILKEASGDNYEIIKVASVSAGVSITADENLVYSYASGDICRKLDYFPNLVMKDKEFPFPLEGPGQYFDLSFECMEVSS